MTMAQASPVEGKELSHALIALLKGIVERDADPVLWQALMNHEAGVRDYAGILGLELRTVEAEGFAYLVQRQTPEGEPELPRLIPRRPLSYPVSLMLALLRKRLAEFDALSGESRLVLSREAIHDTIRLFLPESREPSQIRGPHRRHHQKMRRDGLLAAAQGRAQSVRGAAHPERVRGRALACGFRLAAGGLPASRSGRCPYRVGSIR